MTLWNSLKKKILEHPAQTVCEGETKISYKNLVMQTEKFAEELKGIRCCAILCKSEFMASKALLACFAAQVTVVPLSMRYGMLYCDKILYKISPDAIITDAPGGLLVTRLPDAHYREPDISPALIMCTSGTSGSPKGVMLTEKNIMVNVYDITEYFDIGERDTILISRPLYHCAVLTGEFLTALVKGTKIRFYSDNFNPPAMPELISRYDITAFCGTPTLINMMSRFIRENMKLPLRHIVISGECMSMETGLRIAGTFQGAHIYHVYGLTEACPRVSYLPPELFRKYPDFVGIPLRSVEVKILKYDGTLADAGEEGVLHVKGGNVMMGYYDEPDKTANVLKDGWLCTGDIALINNQGLLKIRGRNDNLIIKAGMNIYPQEIEEALQTDRRVKEVLAYGYVSCAGTQIGLKISGDFKSETEVKRLCMDVLPPYQMPTKTELVPELEKNGSGKIKRGGNYA